MPLTPTTDGNERQHWLMAALTPGLGPVAILTLHQTFGSLSAAQAAGLAAVQRVLRPAVARAWLQQHAAAAVDAALQWEQQSDAFLLTLLDADYPLQLAAAPAPPALLFGHGRRALLQQAMLSIVGSRNAAPLSCSTAHDFAAALSAHGYTIVSGLASGIDSAAHRGGLSGQGASIAVIGTGIDRVYPASNRALARQLARDGLILSEFALGTKPLPGHFPQRNRIIAGLIRACLVIEASVASGSLITARQALDAGRDVLAIPGSIHDPRSRGCHRLIKQGAALIETIDDVLSQIGYLSASPAPPPPTRAAEAHPLLDEMATQAVSIDWLQSRLGLTVAELYAILLQLELEGRVASLPGGRFQRIDLPPPVESPL